MRKKILLFLTTISMYFVFLLNINAETVTCDYGEYKVVYYPDLYFNSDYGKWQDIYDKNGNLVREQIPKHNPTQVSECPKELFIDREEYNVIDHRKVSCGNVTEIPKKIPELTSFAITMIQIAVPVILVIMGAMDLFKGITAQKEDEIKKGQQMFVKRLIVGALIFFVVVIAKLLISVVADASSDDIIDCVDCFLSNECD